MSKKVKKSTLLMLLAFILAAAALFSGCHPWRIAPRPAPTPSPVPAEEPTEAPTETPTEAPTAEITAEPVDTQIPDTAAPTEVLTPTPTPEPTEAPTPVPTPKPTPKPDIPPFSAKSITDGKTYNNSIFATANLTVVNIWAIDCPSCIDELSSFQQLANSYANRGVKVLTILSNSNKDTIPQAQQILQNRGVTLPTLVDNPSVQAAFPCGGTPTTYFIDSNGNILKIEIKAHSYNQWVNFVEGLL